MNHYYKYSKRHSKTRKLKLKNLKISFSHKNTLSLFLLKPKFFNMSSCVSLTHHGPTNYFMRENQIHLQKNTNYFLLANIFL